MKTKPTDEQLKTAWAETIDSKEYIEHAIETGDLANMESWALRMRKRLNYFISLVEDQ